MAYAAVCKYINCAVDTLLALALVANYITSYSVIIINNNNNNNNNNYYYYYYYHYYYRLVGLFGHEFITVFLLFYVSKKLYMYGKSFALMLNL